MIEKSTFVKNKIFKLSLLSGLICFILNMLVFNIKFLLPLNVYSLFVLPGFMFGIFLMTSTNSISDIKKLSFVFILGLGYIEIFYMIEYLAALGNLKWLVLSLFLYIIFYCIYYLFFISNGFFKKGLISAIICSVASTIPIYIYVMFDSLNSVENLVGIRSSIIFSVFIFWQVGFGISIINASIRSS